MTDLRDLRRNAKKAIRKNPHSWYRITVEAIGVAQTQWGWFEKKDIDPLYEELKAEAAKYLTAEEVAAKVPTPIKNESQIKV